MKKLSLIAFVTAILFAAGIQSVKAQSFGVRIGANFANMNLTTTSPLPDLSSNFGLAIGVFGVFKLGSIAIQPEINYTPQGFKYDDATTGIGLKQKMTYLSIPVFVDYYFMDKIFIQAGPYIGFLTSAELTISGPIPFPGGDNKDSFSGTDFGLGFGGGVDLGKIDISLRYYLGLSNVIDDPLNPTDEGKTKSFNLSLGWKFVNKD